jgi:hypothetical protein
MRAFPFLLLALAPSVAAAHHLDDFDSRIRDEAKLPAAWFACRTTQDCGLVQVPCRSRLAVNKGHFEEARDALIDAFPFCLGSGLDDTEAVCEKGQCLTRDHED